jgi:hypothetical protein
LRPSAAAEWVALEQRDLDREAGVVYVRRAFTKIRLKSMKTEESRRAVPLQAIALDAIERQPPSRDNPLLFPGERGGYLDLHNFRDHHRKPAQRAAGIEPLRRIYDLRHTFATFALWIAMPGATTVSNLSVSPVLRASTDSRTSAAFADAHPGCERIQSPPVELLMRVQSCRPSQDQRGMFRPSGTSSAEWW